MPTHPGACHCGRVAFELDGDLGAVVACNCSICRRTGALWHGTDDAHLRVLSDEADLGLYRFGTMTARHYFCRHCGIAVFTRPRIAPKHWVVNLRCVDGIDLATLDIQHFDGRHWEAAAAQFLRQRAAAAD